MRLSQSTSSIVGFCVIAALMGFSLAAHAEDVRKSKPILPSPEYDFYYPGGFVVFTVPTHSELVRMCGQKHEPFPSCSGKDAKGTCVILALPRDEISALGYSYDAVKRHEFGHCNGWPADHPGMRAAADDTSPEKCSCFRTEGRQKIA
jgi:hypothetical protein